jgi:hypothetical protein
MKTVALWFDVLNALPPDDTFAVIFIAAAILAVFAAALTFCPRLQRRGF